MARVILVTGGSRSGKSRYARELAEGLPGPRVFVATCPDMDPEMHERIVRHRQSRDPAVWRTVEEPLDVAGAIRAASDAGAVLVDCLTLWTNNLMYDAEQAGAEVTEDRMADRCAELLAACADHPGTVIFVTNEVGMSIIPDNPASRRYRDLVGRANQVLARGAHVVTLVACGIPVDLKEEG